ncbi:hypothetical protein DPMN_082910 [Dreissena polymorpha]|uniref:EGF-like domain-containing protein n=2 Tax=Dreissena polymorpha TaxID=45954 RepID=A0A9D3Y8D1_DREPO|nr:hypothetical protein DPMN_082910 [Dreissena polymorpha]
MDVFVQTCAFGMVIVYVMVRVDCQTTERRDTGLDLEPGVTAFNTCDTMNCPPNSNCIETSGYASCECEHGKTGVNCTMDDPCLETKENCTKGMTCYGPCNPNVLCEGPTGIPHCGGCIPGFQGKNCDEDEDECTKWADMCTFNGQCTNTFGSFRCDCKVGWTGELCEICALSDTECDAIGRGSVESADASAMPGGVAESLHIAPVSMALTLPFSIILSLLLS